MSKMTPGELAVWAAVFARESSFKNRPNWLLKPGQEGLEWEEGRVREAAEWASSMVSALRGQAQQIKHGHGEDSPTYQMAAEVLGIEPEPERIKPKEPCPRCGSTFVEAKFIQKAMPQSRMYALQSAQCEDCGLVASAVLGEQAALDAWDQQAPALKLIYDKERSSEE